MGHGEKKFVNFIEELQKSFKNGTSLKRQQIQQQEQEPAKSEMVLSRSSSSSNVILRFDPETAAASAAAATPVVLTGVTTVVTVISQQQQQQQTRRVEIEEISKNNELIQRINEIKMQNKKTMGSDVAPMPEWKRQLIEKKRKSKILIAMNN